MLAAEQAMLCNSGLSEVSSPLAGLSFRSVPSGCYQEMDSPGAISLMKSMQIFLFLK